MRKEITTVLALAGVTCLTSASFGQLSFGLQITARSVALQPDGSGQVLFALEARSQAASGNNFGITRAGPGGTTASTRSAITVGAAPASARIGRDINDSNGARRGRPEAFRFVDPRRGLPQPASLWEAQFTNGPNQTNPNLLTGNENGRVTNAGADRSIILFDSYVGISRPALGDGSSPWGASIAPNTWSPWTIVYYFMLDLPPGTPSQFNLAISAQASLGAGTITRQLGDDYLINSSEQQMATATFSGIIPSPAGASLLALAGLAATRRRRA